MQGRLSVQVHPDAPTAQRNGDGPSGKFEAWSVLAAAPLARVALGLNRPSTLEEVIPLLGLVLFGDPKVAKRFFDEHFVVAMDRLAEAWRKVEDRYGLAFEAPDISARAVMGIALVLALESHYTKGFDRNRAVALVER